MKKLLSIFILIPILFVGCSHSNNGGCTNSFTLNGNGFNNETFTLQPLSGVNTMTFSLGNNSPSYGQYGMLNAGANFTSNQNTQIHIEIDFFVSSLSTSNYSVVNYDSAYNYPFNFQTPYCHATMTITNNVGVSQNYSSFGGGTVNIQSIPQCSNGNILNPCNIAGTFNNITFQGGLNLTQGNFCAVKQF